MTHEFGKDISQYWTRIQTVLFPFMKDEVGPCLASHYRVIVTLEVVRIEEMVKGHYGKEVGRPAEDRQAIAREKPVKKETPLAAAKKRV